MPFPAASCVVPRPAVSRSRPAAAAAAAQRGVRTPVTSNDVARLANVSQSAVSRAFTAGASVSEVTRAKVMDAARRLGYRPNAHARSLITGRSRIIGLVLSYLDNLFYPAVLEQLARRLQGDGFHVLLFLADSPSTDADALVGEMLQYNVDGIVLAATTLSSSLAQRCTDAGIPVVLFNRGMLAGAAAGVRCVRSDNVGGGRALADHLVAGGCRRVAFIAGQEDTSTSRERERGLREGLAAHRLRIHARAVGNYDPVQARQAALELFGGAPRSRPDAVFVASDHMAFAVIDALRAELGLRVPRDAAVVGYDDVPQAAWQAYRLTTVAQPVAEMVDAAVGLLHGSLRPDAEAAGAGDVVVPVRLVVRASSRPVPA